MKLGHFSLLFSTIFIFTACELVNHKSSYQTNAAIAPSSLSGKTFFMTTTSGSGVFAEQGTWTVSFIDKIRYEVIGDGEYSIDSEGLYEYLNNGAYGSVKFSDSEIGEGQFILTFSTAGSGEFSAQIAAAPGDKQQGYFEAAGQ